MPLVRGVLYVLMLTPLVFWPSFYYFLVSSKMVFVLAASQVLLVGLVWLWLAHKGWRPKGSWVLMSVLVYALVVTLASVFGVNPLVSFWGSPEREVNTIVLLHLAVVFLAMVSVLRTKQDWHRLFFVSVLVAVAVTAVFFYTSLMRESVPWYAMTHGGSTIGNSSFYGTYLIFHIFFAAILALHAQTRSRKYWMYAIVAFLVLALLMTEAQAAVLALEGGAVLFLGLVLLFRNRSRVQRAAGLCLLVGLFLIASYVAVSLFFPQSPVRQFVVERSGNTRFILWEIAWEGFQDRPLLGWGPENFSSMFQTYYRPELGSQASGGEIWFDRAHNKILDVLAETGVLGLLAYVSILLAALWGIRQAVGGKRLSTTEASLLVALLAANFVQSLMVFDTLTSYLSWFAVLGYIHTRQEERSIPSASRVSPQGMSAFVVLLMTTSVLFYFVTLLPARSSLATKAVFDATTLREHLAPYETAVMRSPHGIDLRRSALAAQTATVILDLSPEHREQFSLILLEELVLAQQGLLDSIDHSPEFLRGYLDLVFLYQVWGRTLDPTKLNKAHELAQLAIDRFPRNPLPYWARVSLLLDEGNLEQATETANKALEVGPLARGSLMRSLITTKFLDDSAQEQEVAKHILDVDPTLQPLVESYLATDAQTHKMELLFRFYYDADF
ncbi:O-antigen ligase family protein [Candidatus Uhrbacteria bacterium]|nr:O-antigen ligase family protein [Candidatus Uhrbacteria bacterium]